MATGAATRWAAIGWLACVGAVAAATQPPGGPRRPGLERLAEVVDRRLGLSDAQAARLRAVSGRYARERQAVLASERQARQTLRAELWRGEAADEGRVGTALDALVAAQQRRAALLAGEQRELAAFLSPVQRAQYVGLQERAQRAAQRLRRARDAERGLRAGPPQ